MRELPRPVRAIAYGLGGAGATLVGGLVLFFVFASKPLECELSCLGIFPAWAGATLAGLLMGLVGGWMPGRSTRAGWIAVGVLGLAIAALMILFRSSIWKLGFIWADPPAWVDDPWWFEWIVLRTMAALLVVFAGGALLAASLRRARR